MRRTGIRIEDSENEVVTVTLLDVLQEIENGDEVYWSILFMDMIGHLGEGISVPEFQKQIRNEERGLFIEWKEIQTCRPDSEGSNPKNLY